MVCKVNCAAIEGIDVKPVTIETDVCGGLPSFDMVGLLASDTRESRQRVRTALKNSGFSIPPKRITINFSPADIRKSGTYYDLPIAVSILFSFDFLGEIDISDKMFIGELSLDGKVVPVSGVLPIAMYAAECGMSQCFVPKENQSECDFLEGIEVIGVSSLLELLMYLEDERNKKDKGAKLEMKTFRQREDCRAEDFEDDRSCVANSKRDDEEYDFCEIHGQAQARFGAEIAAAGMHNMLLLGPPGTGKSIIARSMPGIMPDMTFEEKIEISRIQSIAGILDGGLVSKRPIRSPHYTATLPAMTGGGRDPRPGEMTLAHNGILYMDEFPEFSRGVIESLRQPMEEGKILVSRSGGSYAFPARFVLVAAMNPCKCGYYPDRNRCSCTIQEVRKYLDRVSGPIFDRIDICARMNAVEFRDIKNGSKQESSAQIKKRVQEAALIQRERYKNEEISFNGQLKGALIRKYCPLGKKENEVMEQIYHTFSLSVRGYEKILKVSRTIADLCGNKNISESDIAKAAGFRQNLTSNI